MLTGIEKIISSPVIKSFTLGTSLTRSRFSQPDSVAGIKSVDIAAKINPVNRLLASTKADSIIPLDRRIFHQENVFVSFWLLDPWKISLNIFLLGDIKPLTYLLFMILNIFGAKNKLAKFIGKNRLRILSLSDFQIIAINELYFIHSFLMHPQFPADSGRSRPERLIAF